MNFDFFLGFQPKIIHISKRERMFWDQLDNVVDRKQTIGHLLILACDGEGTLQINEQQYSLQRGMLSYIAPGSRMRIATQNEHSLRFYSILFHHGPWKWNGSQPIWDMDSRSTTPLPVPEMSNFIGKPILFDVFNKMVEIWSRKETGYEWHAKLKFLHLLEIITATLHKASQKNSPDTYMMEAVVSYIDEHLQEPLDRKTLASRVSLSPPYFASLFKQYTGHTLAEFVNRRRIERAKELLYSTNLQVYQIADEVGYKDSFYFSRQFRRIAGMTPSEFRKI